MKRIRRYALVAILPGGLVLSLAVRSRYARKPLFCDDDGTHVKARLAGLAGNLIYRKDIVLDFESDPNGNLLTSTEHEFLTFL